MVCRDKFLRDNVFFNKFIIRNIWFFGEYIIVVDVIINCIVKWEIYKILG